MNTLEALCQDWLAAKESERKAAALRVAIEDMIVGLTGKRDEGAQTHEAGAFKVAVTGKVIRKMDWDKWDQVKGSIPANLHPVKMKPELDEKGVKWLRDNDPALYALLPIEIKPAKTAVEVKPVGGGA
jgi:hypothetical protein